MNTFEINDDNLDRLIEKEKGEPVDSECLLRKLKAAHGKPPRIELWQEPLFHFFLLRSGMRNRQSAKVTVSVCRRVNRLIPLNGVRTVDDQIEVYRTIRREKPNGMQVVLSTATAYFKFLFAAGVLEAVAYPGNRE